MRAEKLFLLINEIDDRLIAEAEGNDEQPVEVVLERRFPIKEIIALAACAAALVICVYAVTHVRGGITPPPDSENNSTASSSAVISSGGNSSESINISDSSSETSDTSETSESSDNSDSESNISDTVVSINSEVLWGLGKTFDEVNERYGGVVSGGQNVYSFENGYGRYAWDSKGIDPQQSDRDVNIEIVRGNGGCRSIDGVKPHDLFNGEFTSLSFEALEANGFEVGPRDDSPYTMYDGYRFRTFTHPSYENISFSAMYSEKTGVIDDETSIMIRLNETSETPHITLNQEALWGMGRTFDEVTERYGEVTSGNFNTYFFEGGYGRYVWDYGSGIDNSFADVNENIEYIKTRGGVVMMDNIKANELLIGEFTTLDYEQFADICGITYTEPGEEPPGMYDTWTIPFTHPFYENMTFHMYMKEPGVIDETTTFVVRSDDF